MILLTHLNFSWTFLQLIKTLETFLRCHIGLAATLAKRNNLYLVDWKKWIGLTESQSRLAAKKVRNLGLGLIESKKPISSQDWLRLTQAKVQNTAPVQFRQENWFFILFFKNLIINMCVFMKQVKNFFCRFAKGFDHLWSCKRRNSILCVIASVSITLN